MGRLVLIKVPSAGSVLAVVAGRVWPGSNRNGIEHPKSQTSVAADGTSPRSELVAALATCRSAFLGIGLFSGVSNILMLTGSFYMLEIYDRVLTSRSIPTLVAISILAGVLFMAQGLIDLFAAGCWCGLANRSMRL